jgi:ribosomal protein S18 acetylase RimI-like enzyme
MLWHPAPMKVRRKEPADRHVLLAFYDDHASARVARLGELVHPIEHPALLAEDDGRLAGVLTYIMEGEQCEILTLHSADQSRGAGSALIDAVERLAVERGCTGLFLITTNDNVDALRFYQRRGFHLAALYPGAVDESRAQLKREIPEVGEHGIPLRDEIVLAKRL